MQVQRYIMLYESNSADFEFVRLFVRAYPDIDGTMDNR